MDESLGSHALFRRATRLPSRALSVLLAVSLVLPLGATASMASESSSAPGSVDPASAAVVTASSESELSGVKLEAPERLEIGETLVAKAYSGSSQNPEYISDGVTYVWKYSKVDPTDYSFSEDQWNVIEGESESQLTVEGEQYAGAYFAVDAVMGDKTVSLSVYNAVGPFRLAGQVDIYSAYLQKDGESTYLFSEDDTAVVRAKDKETSSVIPSDRLRFQWLVSEDKKRFEEIPGATSESLSLDGLAGKFVRCRVEAKVGGSSRETGSTSAIAKSGSINVTSVVLDKTGNVNVGDVIVAKANAGSVDVTESDKVFWAWYAGDSSYSANQRIDGVEGNELQVTDALLGKYVQARADGGYGESKSSSAGPVVIPGAVDLYQVSVSGDARIGSVLTAKATKGNSYTPVEESDVVSYQWQYAENKTTVDSAFVDIEGATSEFYKVQPGLEGKYLRVKATSLNVQVSTKEPYHGSVQSVDPVGPIMLEGQYRLSSVALSSSGQGMQVGNVITPKAKVKDGYFESDVPEDAKTTYSWKVSDAEAGPYAELSDGVDPSSGALSLGESLVGKFVKVSVSALDNTVSSSAFRVVESGSFDLLRVTTSLQMSSSSTKLFVGDEIEATVQAKNLSSVSFGDDVTDEVSVKWLVSDGPDGDFTLLSGCESAKISIPEEAAGKYIKVVASSGSSSVELVGANPVIDPESLDGIAAKLVEEDWRLDLSDGQTTNANEPLRAKLVEMGADDVVVSVESVAYSGKKEGARGGISFAADSTNGQIEPFFVDPGTVSSTGYELWRQVKPIYRLTRDGQSVLFEPNRTSSLPWDEERAKDLLEDVASVLSVQYAEGDQALSVTEDLVLPYKVPGSGWSNVVWRSSSPAVVVSGYGWEDYDGRVVRTSEDQEVVLTAEVSMAIPGGFESVHAVTFPITVKGDPSLAESERKELASKVESAFVPENVKELSTGTEVDLSAVSGDLAFPTPREIGVDGKYYEVSYRASDDAVVVNGYAGKVYRGLPGTHGRVVDIVCTVSKKSDPSVSASKTISATVVPLSEEEIADERKLMEETKARLFEGISNGQSQAFVSGDLKSFQKAYRSEDGTIAWSYDRATTDAQAGGIVPDDIDLSHPSEQWNLFKSSRPDLIAHETLRLLKQPEYDTKVGIEACLSSKMFARYAERYADVEGWGEAFAGLSRQQVLVEVTVKGLKDGSDPNPPAEDGVQVSFSLSGPGMGFSTPVSVKEGATVYDAFAKALSSQGYSWKGSTYVSSVTSPSGVTLRAGQFGANSGWMYQVDGVFPDVYAGSYYLKGGERVSWIFVGGSSSGGETQENPDGSTTTVETKPDGSTVESTVWPDGSSSVSTVRPDGVSATVAKDPEGNVTSVEAKVPESAAQGIVDLPVEGVDASQEGASVLVKIEAPAGTRVSVPAKNAGAGTVAIVVMPDGTERVLRDSTVFDGSVVFGLEGACTVKVVDAPGAFEDVEDDAWYADSVRFSSSRLLMTGMGGASGVFAPEASMDRAMFVTVLNRLAYDAIATEGPAFGDVDERSWYGNAVSWASECGIVHGYGETGAFGPEDLVTREQIVVFLMRYANMRGLDTSVRTEAFSARAEAEGVSAWAQDAMSWAVASGLVLGDEETGALRPCDGASRAEAATIVMRFVDLMTRRP